MGSAHVASSQHCPDRIIPCGGTVAEYSSHIGLNKEPWNVLKECVAGSYFAKHAVGIRPQVALVGCAFALACDTPGLAGEAGAEDIDMPVPGMAVELPHVAKEGEPGQASIGLALQEHPLAVGVDLDGAHRPVAEEEVG